MSATGAGASRSAIPHGDTYRVAVVHEFGAPLQIAQVADVLTP